MRMSRNEKKQLRNIETPLERGGPPYSERMIALGLSQSDPSAKYTAWIMAAGVAIILIGLLSGTAFWILGAVQFVIGLIAHCTSPTRAQVDNSATTGDGAS
jgi:hypothetical protein